MSIIGSLTTKQIAGLSTTAIVALTTSDVAELSTTQIGALSATQINAFETTDLQALRNHADHRIFRQRHQGVVDFGASGPDRYANRRPHDDADRSADEHRAWLVELHRDSGLGYDADRGHQLQAARRPDHDRIRQLLDHAARRPDVYPGSRPDGGAVEQHIDNGAQRPGRGGSVGDADQGDERDGRCAIFRIRRWTACRRRRSWR